MVQSVRNRQEAAERLPAGNGDGLSFEEWRSRFLADAKAQGLLHNAEQLGDTALRLFWERGTVPTVRSVIESAE
jgi:hypothetical protein